MAAWPTMTFGVDCSDILDAMKEAAELMKQIGGRVPPHIKLRCQQLDRREDGFSQVITETGQDGQITIKVLAGHDLLCLLADLRAQQPA